MTLQSFIALVQSYYLTNIMWVVFPFLSIENIFISESKFKVDIDEVEWIISIEWLIFLVDGDNLSSNTLQMSSLSNGVNANYDNHDHA